MVPVAACVDLIDALAAAAVGLAFGACWETISQAERGIDGLGQWVGLAVATAA